MDKLLACPASMPTCHCRMESVAMAGGATRFEVLFLDEVHP